MKLTKAAKTANMALKAILAGIILGAIVYVLMGIAVDFALAAPPPKIIVCHVLSEPPQTMEIPEPALPAHLSHGDYLGPCDEPESTETPSPVPTDDPPTSSPTPEPTDSPPTPTDEPIPTKTPTVEPEPPGSDSAPATGLLWLLTRGNWHCLIFSESHPSVERQRALCFPRLDPNWQATNAPCAAPVMDDDTWECDNLTPWRLPLEKLRGIHQRHLNYVD